MRAAIVGCLAGLALSTGTVTRAQVPGGWSKVSVKDEGVVAAAAFAIAARQAAGGQEGDGKLSLVEILDAHQQVVAGMNYRLMLRVREGETVRRAEATVWARVWLEGDERYQLTAWRTVDEPARLPLPRAD